MDGVCTAQFGLGHVSTRCPGQARIRTRAIDDEIVVVESAEFFLEPVHVFQEISGRRDRDMPSEHRQGHTHSLEAVDETTVWTHGHLGHDVFEGDELPDVDGGLIFKGIPSCGGVEIDDVDSATGELEMGGKGGAESGLSCTGWASDEDGVAHRARGGQDKMDCNSEQVHPLPSSRLAASCQSLRSFQSNLRPGLRWTREHSSGSFPSQGVRMGRA